MTESTGQRLKRGTWTHTAKAAEEARYNWLTRGDVCHRPYADDDLPSAAAYIGRCDLCRPFWVGCTCDLCGEWDRRVALNGRAANGGEYWVPSDLKRELGRQMAESATRERLSALVRPLDPWQIAEQVVASGMHCTLHGPPGTGKTHTALRHAIADTAEVYAVTVNRGSIEAEFRGSFTPLPGGQGFRWGDGPAILAWRQGARLVVNEIGEASEDLLTAMYAIADDPDTARLTLPTGERLTPAGGFQMIATTNEHPDTLPDALMERLHPFAIPTVHPGAIATLPEALRPAAEATANATGEHRWSIRAWHRFVHLTAHLVTVTDRSPAQSAADAAVMVFGDQATDVLAAVDVRSLATADAWSTT